MTTRRLAVLPVLLGLTLLLPLAAPAAAGTPAEDRVLRGYAADTWRSFELLLDPATALPSDNVSDAGERSRYTSPTNIGPYLWSTLAARDIGVISAAEARRRIATTRGGDPARLVPGHGLRPPGRPGEPARLRRDFDVYGEGGFYDAVNVDTGQVSRFWLALDQGMVMAALGNELTGDRLQRYLTRGAVERAVRPLLAMEEFTAGG